MCVAGHWIVGFGATKGDIGKQQTWLLQWHLCDQLILWLHGGAVLLLLLLLMLLLLLLLLLLILLLLLMMIIPMLLLFLPLLLLLLLPLPLAITGGHKTWRAWM
jgi:hypothetical protein